jgi:hypothetical protein
MLTWWDVTDATAKLQRTLLTEVRGIADDETRVLVLHADARFAISRADKKLRLWELATGQVRRVIDGAAVSVKLSPDGKLLAIGKPAHPYPSEETELLLQRVADKESFLKIKADAGIEAVAFSHDSRLLAGVGHEGAVHLWQTATGATIPCTLVHPGGATALAFLPDGKSLATGGLDSTLLIWDLTPLLRPARPGRKPDRAPTAPDDLRFSWDQLADSDGWKAFDALCRLEKYPQAAVALAKSGLPAAAPIDEAPLIKLLPDLGSSNFQVRQRAVKALERAGEQAADLVRRAQAQSPNVEHRRHLTNLLDRLDGPLHRPEHLQAMRGVELLESIGTPEARAVLVSLSQGAPRAWLTRWAREALRRLDARDPGTRAEP